MCFLSMQHVTVVTGVLTAVTGVSVKMERCVTPSQALVSAQLATAAGGVRSAASRAPMEQTASRNANVKTMPPATTSQGSVHAALAILEHCKLYTHANIRTHKNTHKM